MIEGQAHRVLTAAMRGQILAYDAGVEERAACAQLKRRFEAAGFRIKENQTFDEDGVWFEIDGFDAARRVGYEYVTAEAGDGWDVDGDVIATLAERRKAGELFVLVVDEADAPDAGSLDRAIDAFLAELPAPKAEAPPEAPPEATTEAPAAKAESKSKPPPTPAAAKGARKKPARKPKSKPPPTPAAAKGARKKPARKPK